MWKRLSIDVRLASDIHHRSLSLSLSVSSLSGATILASRESGSKRPTSSIARARDFHLLDRQLFDFVSSFDPAPPVRTMSFQYLGIDLQRAKEIFHALQSFDAPPAEQESQRQWHLQGGQGRVIGDEYFSQEHFQSFKLLLR